MAAEFHLEVMAAPMQRVFATVAPLLSVEGFYLVDADAEPTPRLRTRLSWRAVKAFLREQAQRVFG